MSSTSYNGSVAVSIVAADKRCEMCGALVMSDGIDHKETYEAVEALRRIADIWLQDEVACHIILARLSCPDATYREIGRMVGRSDVTVIRHMQALEKAHPEVGYFVRSHGPNAQAQKRRKA